LLGVYIHAYQTIFSLHATCPPTFTPDMRSSSYLPASYRVLNVPIAPPTVFFHRLIVQYHGSAPYPNPHHSTPPLPPHFALFLAASASLLVASSNSAVSTAPEGKCTYLTTEPRINMSFVEHYRHITNQPSISLYIHRFVCG
jgi:hypothetical protein